TNFLLFGWMSRAASKRLPFAKPRRALGIIFASSVVMAAGAALSTASAVLRPQTFARHSERTIKASQSRVMSGQTSLVVSRSSCLSRKGPGPTKFKNQKGGYNASKKDKGYKERVQADRRAYSGVKSIRGGGATNGY